MQLDPAITMASSESNIIPEVAETESTEENRTEVLEEESTEELNEANTEPENQKEDVDSEETSEPDESEQQLDQQEKKQEPESIDDTANKGDEDPKDNKVKMQSMKIEIQSASLPYKQGDKNKEIIEIKKKLNAIGFDRIAISDYFGSWTETRVKQFQKNYELPVTGVIDEKTLEKLDEVYNSPFHEGKV